MNYLALVNALKEKTPVPGTALSVLAGQNDQITRMTNWIKDSWDEIQRSRRDWLWMRGTFSFQTVVGTNEYTAATAGATTFASWYRDDFRIYLTSVGRSGEQDLSYITYNEWREWYDFGANATAQGFPIDWTERPATKAIILAQIPNAIYTVTGEYHKAPTTLSADADIPGMPDRFHMMIVFKAMMRFGLFYGAQEIYDDGKAMYAADLIDLEREQLPDMDFA